TWSSHDLAVSPTLLRLVGTVVDAATTPKEGVLIQIQGSPLSGALGDIATSTDAGGMYEVYALLHAGATDGTLEYHLSTDTQTTTETRSFTAPAAHQVNTVTQSFTLPAASAP